MPDSPNPSSPQSKPGLKPPGMEPTEAEVASAIGSLEQSLKSLPAAAPATKPLPSLRQDSSRQRRKSPGLFWLTAGVIFPALVVLLEVTTGFCASVFFDPIPTVWHMLVAAFVPAVNFLIWLALRKDWREHRRALGWLSGAAIGGAAFYTLVFLPLMPIGAFALILFGLGLLPMAPLFALIASITGRRYLRRWQEQPAKLPGLWPGLALTLIVLAAATLPDVMTRFGLEMAASADAATSRRGDAWLRWMGDRDSMLRNCYARPGRTDFVSFLFSFGGQVNPEEARRIYYRVTGAPFSDAPRPELKTGRSLFDWFDTDRGGSAAGGRAKDLSMASSRMDQSVDANAGVSYLEWTLLFKNQAAWQQEARTQIALPPGGVVSRLTLWVNGEEREAAFAARGKVRQAYEQVVRQRRDPVLVTTSGPDRVLVQCFPVPPDGGEMKIRIGITAPVQL
ncbi:MAG TPA: VIT domain-containing protein, partial [Anaerolineales bacterium]